MSANTILTSVITGGANSHTTTAEEINATATDFATQGVVGAITLNTGSGGTGSFCVNQDGSADMGVTIKAGQAYVAATPSSQNAQVLRSRAAADYTTYVINSNASGSTKYDWIYLKIDATKANSPAADASDVASFVTSRSSSNTTDNGTPPTYGLLLAIVTVANAASSITNSNITDKRVNASMGAQGGSLVVSQASTGTDAKVIAAGQDANINLDLTPKGTGTIVTPNNVIQANSLSTTAIKLGKSTPITAQITTVSTTNVQATGLTVTVTVPAGGRSVKITAMLAGIGNATSGAACAVNIWSATVGSGTLLNELVYFSTSAGSTIPVTIVAEHTPAAGSVTYNLGYRASSGTAAIAASSNGPSFMLVELI